MEGWEAPDPDLGARTYYNPAQLAEVVGSHAVDWYATRCCIPPSSKRVRLLAKAVLVVAALLSAVAQWSMLASGVSLFADRINLNTADANSLTSAALSVCFLSCIVGGILGDGSWGACRVLTVGLSVALGAAAVVATLSYDYAGFASVGPRAVLSVAVFGFAAALGLVQTSLTTLVGDQCHDSPSQLGPLYNVYYGAVQLGAFAARMGFPIVDDRVGWFVGVVAFVALPVGVALVCFASHTAVMAQKVPVARNPVGVAAKVLAQRLCGRTPQQLRERYSDRLIRDSLRTARVLRLHLTLPVFWALYFQMFGLWYLQTKDLRLELWPGLTIVAEQATMLNPLFDVVCLALFSGVFYALRRLCGLRFLPQWKMLAGYFFACAAFACATFLQYKVELHESQYSVVWQLPQFVFICAAEVLVYPPALHLAYVNSPTSTRSFVQSALWFFIGVGNLLNIFIVVATQNFFSSNKNFPVFVVYLSLMGLTTVLFAFLSYFYDEHPADAEDQRYRSPSPSSINNNSPTPPYPNLSRPTSSLTPASRSVGEAEPPADQEREERQVLLGNPYSGSPSQLSQQRRVPTPRDPRRGGVQYYSTRKSPRTSALAAPQQ